MFSAEDDDAGAGTGPPGGRTPVTGAEGWSFLPFERNEDTAEHHITLERDEDEERVEMTLPSFVERGDELEQIALLVIRARERWRDLKGLGG
jgi:hypothetical protein